MTLHPNEALFQEEKSIPIIPFCEHFAGSEKLIGKALQIQNQSSFLFDITCDCEDGAQMGQEQQHAQMIVDMQKSEQNIKNRMGVRIHDFTHPNWKQDIDIIVPAIGEKIAYITIPKTYKYENALEMLNYIQNKAKECGMTKKIPLHILIETHGALKDIWKIAQLDWLEVLDFGLMDFVSSHYGAIESSNMNSPGQFDHKLIARAKTELVAAAYANGLIPTHNVTLDLKNEFVTYQDAIRAKKEFGFLRMWSIYPTQINSIIKAMQPNHKELDKACGVLVNAYKMNWGPIQYEGELHDRATYRYFWTVVQQAKYSGISLNQEINELFF